MRTYKKNLKSGEKKTFGKLRGVKVRLINKNHKKKNNKNNNETINKK